jgi:hypothetical protein
MSSAHPHPPASAPASAWWRDRAWWGMCLLIMLGRLGWWAYWGLLLEADSVGYLELQAALYHPPGYTLLATLVSGLARWVDAVVVVQALLYAGAAALLVRRHFQAGRWAWGMALVLALEPCSGQLGAAVMAETSFLACLLLAWTLLAEVWKTPQHTPWRLALLAGVLLGAAYLFRYAAPVFVVAALIHPVLRRWPWRRVAVAALFVLLGFQAVLLPLRVYYKTQFGTWTLNAFTGASLWNLSAYLYPGSEVQAHPQGPFEQHLQAFADSNFIMKTTRYTNHIFQSYRPYPRYVALLGGDAPATVAASAEVGRTAMRLIAGQPVRHLRELVLPNLLRPLSQRDSIYADGLSAMIGRPIATHRRMRWEYNPVLWGLALLLLVAATVVQIWKRGRLPALAGLLLLSAWLYYLAIALLSVVFLRFLYILPPLVLLAIGLQCQALLAARRPQARQAG